MFINRTSQEFLLPTKLLVSLGLVFFIVSLLITSLFTSGEDIRGFWVLALGWIGLIIFQFSWFANPLNLLALLLLDHRPKMALLLSVIALILASQAFTFSEIPAGAGQEKIHIQQLGLGFYFWYLSQGLFLIAIIIEALGGHKKTEASSVSL